MPQLRLSLRKILGLGIAAALALRVIACSDTNASQVGGGDPDPDSVATASTKAIADKPTLCNQLRGLDASIENLRMLDNAVTVDTARAAAQQLSASLDSVTAATSDAAASRFAAIKLGFDALLASVQNIPGDQQLGAVVTVLTSQLLAIANAGTNLKSQTGC